MELKLICGIWNKWNRCVIWIEMELKDGLMMFVMMGFFEGCWFLEDILFFIKCKVWFSVIVLLE